MAFAGAALLWSRSCVAQQTARRIAVVPPSDPVAILSADGPNHNWRMFYTELNRLGFTEGKNLLVERYSGEGRAHGYADLARDTVTLVRWRRLPIDAGNNLSIPEQHTHLVGKMRGHYAYYGISGNSRRLQWYAPPVARIWRKCW